METWDAAIRDLKEMVEKAEADKELCQAAAQKANDAACIASADNNRLRDEVGRLTWREHELHEFLNWKPRDSQDRYVYGLEQQPKGSFKQVREFIDCLAARYDAEHDA
jgi:hypothetical protein